MAVAPEPGETKCPDCSSAMAPVLGTKEEGQSVRHLDCPDCGYQLKEPAGLPRRRQAGKAGARS